VTFSYIPGGRRLDRIRLLMGDTDRQALEDSRLEDEEIEALLATFGGDEYVAAEGLDILATKFARKGEQTAVGSDRNVISSREVACRARARQLRQNAATKAVPSAGAVSRASKDSADADIDRLTPTFKIGMLDNPEVS
jgi:hypothetical protein